MTNIDNETVYRLIANKLSANSQTNGRLRGDVFEVELWYPRDSEVKAVEVSLIDVRSADDIRISYDYDRNGWVIWQRAAFDWPDDDVVNNPGWQEVAFCKAWARDKSHLKEGT